MTPGDFENNITTNINAGLTSGVHPSILVGILYTKATQVSLMLLKGEQPAQPNGENVVGLEQPEKV